MKSQFKFMNPTYKILFLEDDPDDVEFIREELDEAKVDFISRQVETKQAFLEEIEDFCPDIVLADYSLPSFNGMKAFELLKNMDLQIPFILVTGALSEQLALECLSQGVDDFILKSSFKRLPAAIINAIKKKESEKEKIRMAFELKKSHEELQLLLGRHHIAREEERKTIARDLHDELGQVLTGLKIDITMLWKKLAAGKISSPQVVDEEFGSIMKLIDKTMQSAIRISSGLRPEILDELGVIEAIRWLAQEFEARNKIVCKVILPSELLEIDRDFSIALFRIVQETLTNVVRHAHATRVEIHLEVKDAVLFLEIIDNGKGISDQEIANSNSLGIIGLRERVRFLNGIFDIQGQTQGTVVSVTIPLYNLYVMADDKSSSSR